MSLDAPTLWVLLGAVALWRVDRWMAARKPATLADLADALPPPPINAEIVELTPMMRRDSSPLPMDLEAFASNESEAWAREQSVAALRDVYLETRSWDRVRAAVIGTGE